MLPLTTIALIPIVLQAADGIVHAEDSIETLDQVMKATMGITVLKLTPKVFFILSKISASLLL